MFNLTQPALVSIIKIFGDKIFNILKIGLEEGKSFQEIAKQHNLHPLISFSTNRV